MKRNPYIRLASFALDIKKELSVKILLNLIVLASCVTQAFMLAYGTSSVFSNKPVKLIITYYLVAAGCVAARSILTRVIEGYTKRVAGTAKSLVRDKVVGKLIDLGPQYQSMKRSGRLQSLVTDGIEYVEPYLVNYIPQIFVVLISSTSIGGYLLSLDRNVGGVVIAALLIAILMPYLMMPFVRRSAMGYWQGYAELNAQYIDSMQGMNTLKALNAADRKGVELHQNAEAFRSRQIKWTAYSLISLATIALMMAAGKYLTTGIAAYDMAKGLLGQADLLVILFLVIESMRPIGELEAAWHASYLGLSVSHELLEIMDEPVKILDREGSMAGLDAGFPSIEFDSVSFRYPSRQESALDKVSFRVEPGETVAIVGKSGSGKSTVVNLLLRFYEAEKGRVKVSDVDLRDYSIEYLRGKISVVFQDTYLFYGTVEENIGLARPGATRQEIIQAAKMASAHEFISELPDGYKTLVGERGATLSGGQKQRIAIARAILKDAPILIFDEATSSVDAANEQIIQNTLMKLKQRYTGIVIAHRLSAIRHIRKILVFDRGRIVESGSHDELVAAGGVYKELLDAQLGMEGCACGKA